MKSALQNQVLVLNRLWQPITTKSVQEIIPMLCTNVATAMLIDGEEIRPVTWDEWTSLPVRENDDAVHSVRFTIRAPTVILLLAYSKVPKKRPKLGLRGVAQRDGGRCQYSGKALSREEMSVDHVLPRSRGGKDEWENLVLAHKDLNQKKGNKLNHEVGLKLLRQPKAPAVVPVSAMLRATHPHHELFLKG